MNKKKLLISGLTVAGFLAASVLPLSSFAGDETTPAKEDQKVEGKKGSCAGGSCGAMKEKGEKEEKEAKGKKKGSCSGMKDEGEKKEEGKKEEGKKGSCTAMKE